MGWGGGRWTAGSTFGSPGMYVLGSGERGLRPAWDRREGKGEGDPAPSYPHGEGSLGHGHGTWTGPWPLWCPPEQTSQQLSHFWSSAAQQHCPPHPLRRGFKRRPGRSGEYSGQSPILGQWLWVGGGRPCLVRKPKHKSLPGTGQRAPRATWARNHHSCSILKISVLGLIRVDVWQKTAKSYKVMILQLKVNIKKKKGSGFRVRSEDRGDHRAPFLLPGRKGKYGARPLKYFAFLPNRLEPVCPNRAWGP